MNCPYRCFSSADVGAVRETPLRPPMTIILIFLVAKTGP
jgi:hypothetical protein